MWTSYSVNMGPLRGIVCPKYVREHGAKNRKSSKGPLLDLLQIDRLRMRKHRASFGFRDFFKDSLMWRMPWCEPNLHLKARSRDNEEDK